MIHRLMSCRSTTLGIQCWNCSVMRTLACTWKYWSAQRNWGELHSRVILLLTSYATKVRSAVLNNSTLCGTIAPQESLHWPSPDAQTRSSDGGLTLFPSQLFCQTLDKTEVSSACGYVLYYWCACRRSRASAVDGPKLGRTSKSGTHLVNLWRSHAPLHA